MVPNTKLDGLDSEFRKKIEAVLDVAKAVILKQGYDSILITSGRRSMAEQERLYKQGRTTDGNIVTNAQAGSSAHNFGKAVDFVLMKSGKCQWDAPIKDWSLVGGIAKLHGLTWGGDFQSIKDYPHIECPTWKIDRSEWRKGKVQIP